MTSPSWTLPHTIEPRQVHPDCVDLTKTKMVGKESDPGRMGVWVCLLDQRPHLHPSLHALNKHRQTIHHIAMPADPVNDLPLSQRQTVVETCKVPEDVLAVLQGLAKGIGAEAGEEGKGVGEGEEWFAWKFTEEQEARRRAYLPLI